MNYEQMTEEEINFEVFHKLSDGIWDKELSLKVWNLLSDKYDYCNDPSDAMPILIENKIGFKWVNKSCTASSISEGYHEFSDKNPLRAAMVVFLIMNEGD